MALWGTGREGVPTRWLSGCMDRSWLAADLPLLLETMCAGKLARRLQQAELGSTRDGFGAALDLEFGKDVSIVPLDGVQGEEQPPSDLLIGAALRHELEDFGLARAECFD